MKPLFRVLFVLSLAVRDDTGINQVVLSGGGV